MKKLATSLLACLSVGTLTAATLVTGLSASGQDPSGTEDAIRLDFNETLYTAVVGKEPDNTTAADVVEMKDGVFHLLATNGPGLYSKVLNQIDFAAGEDVEITFDYKGIDRTWSDEKIVIGAKGDKQWGGILLKLANTAEGTVTVTCLKEDLTTVLASGGSAPLAANTLYHFRIALNKSAGRMDVYVTKDGDAESGVPLMAVTDDQIKTLSGGIAFQGWATEYTVDNMKITAGGKTLLDDDFSDRDFDMTHENSEEGAYAVMENGALKVYGWDTNGDGKSVISTGLTGRTDLSSFTMTMDYTPTDTTWNVDTILLGYKNDGTRQNCLGLTLEGTGNSKKAKLEWNNGSAFVTLDDTELALTSGTTYSIQVAVDTAAGNVSASITPAGGTAVNLSVESNDYVKTMAGDIGVVSWAGNYTVDNVVVIPQKVVTTTTTEITTESTASTTKSTTATTKSTTATTKSTTATTKSTTTATESTTESTSTTQKPVVSTVTLDFNDSLKVATVEKDPSNTTDADLVEMKDGVFHLLATNGPGLYSKVLNQIGFAASEDVEITFDYKGIDRTWSDDKIVIGAKGDKQWGGIVLRLANTAEGTVTVTCLKEDLSTVLGTGGSTPLEANAWYRIRIVLNKSAGRMDVYVTKDGDAASSAPTLSVTDESIRSLSGGIAFGGWATEYTVDNLKIVANGKILQNADFSTLPEDMGHPDNLEEGTAVITGGALKLNGWNSGHTSGSMAITKGLLGVDDLKNFDLSLEYTPADVQWSIDKLLLGYKDNAKEQDALVLKFMGNEQKVVLEKNAGGVVTELDSSVLTLDAGVTYTIHASVDTDTGKVTISVCPAGGAPVELSATDDFIKDLKGDIGFASWGGEYSVDNVKVTAYGMVLPDTSTTTPSGSSQTPHTGDTTPLAATAVFAVAAVVLLTVKSKRGEK